MVLKMISRISDTLHNLMRGPLVVAQMCALFPVSGIMTKTSYKLRFCWCNHRFLYSISIWSSLIYIMYITLATEQMDDTSLSVLNARLLDVIAPPVAFFPLFLQISYKWRQFVNKWELIEKKLPVFRRISNLESKLNLIFIVFVSSRLGSVVVEFLKTLWKCIDCLPLNTWAATVDAMFLVHYHQVFIYTTPAVWKYIGLLLVDVIIALQWISCSLLITFLSLILTAQLRRFNNQLEAFKLQLMPNTYWQEMRESYNNLSQLTTLLDSLLSPMVLATFIVETLNIIVFIYDAINSPKDTIAYVVSAFGCARVVLVNLVTQLSICAVYEESKKPLEVFGLVPSPCYCKEVERLYEQVATDTLALTGCQFFYVTRSVILTMVSTIVTYEVVLIQFGEYEPQTLPTNSTAPEYCDTWVIPRYNSHL